MAESPQNPLGLPETATCPDCGYCLFASVLPRCPECGKEFDPLSFLIPRKRPPTSDEMMRLKRPGRLQWSLVLSIVVLGITMLEPPVGDDDWKVAAILFLVGAVVVSMLDVTAIGIIRLRRNVPVELRRWHLLPRAAQLGILVFAIFFIESGSAFSIGFWVSKPMLDSLANQVLTTRQLPPDHWVGVFHAKYISLIANGMNFRLGAWNDCRGLEYIVPGQMPMRPFVQYRHLGGNWYAFN